MRLITFIPQTNGPSIEPEIGVCANDESHVVPLKSAALALGIDHDTGQLDNMNSLISQGSPGIALAREIADKATQAGLPDLRLAPETIRFLSPVPIPNSIRDCMEFEQHLLQCTQTVVKWRAPPIYWLDRLSRQMFGRGFLRVPRVWHERPVYYKGNRRSVVGHAQPVLWPAYTGQLDFELEFGIFVGKGGKNISVSSAAEHIAGYCLFNDFSARDVQLHEMAARLGPAKGKDFDTGNSIGPWLTTPDEIDERALEFEIRVNGELWSRTNTAQMKFCFAELVAYISHEETLFPGDFIASGTLPDGCGLEMDRWIQPGDEIELGGGPLGRLRNRVVTARL